MPPKVARLCKTFANNMEEDDDNITDTDLYCPRVNGDILEKVVEFCTHYVTVEPMTEIKLPFQNNASTVEDVVKQEFYCKFIQRNERHELIKFVQAANFLDIPSLLSLSVLALCVGINNKSAEEIQTIFKITPPGSGQEENMNSSS